jgi:hypothetical protein
MDLADDLLEDRLRPRVAASLICDRLTGGKTTAIDRSAPTVDIARGRNCSVENTARVHLSLTARSGAAGVVVYHSRHSFDTGYRHVKKAVAPAAPTTSLTDRSGWCR